jgi:hypothetical protein
MAERSALSAQKALKRAWFELPLPAMHTFSTDNEKGLLADDVVQYLEAKGVYVNPHPPYSPQANSYAEVYGSQVCLELERMREAGCQLPFDEALQEATAAVRAAVDVAGLTPIEVLTGLRGPTDVVPVDVYSGHSTVFQINHQHMGARRADMRTRVLETLAHKGQQRATQFRSSRPAPLQSGQLVRYYGPRNHKRISRWWGPAEVVADNLETGRVRLDAAGTPVTVARSDVRPWLGRVTTLHELNTPLAPELDLADDSLTSAPSDHEPAWLLDCGGLQVGQRVQFLEQRGQPEVLATIQEVDSVHNNLRLLVDGRRRDGWVHVPATFVRLLSPLASRALPSVVRGSPSLVVDADPTPHRSASRRELRANHRPRRMPEPVSPVSVPIAPLGVDDSPDPCSDAAVTGLLNASLASPLPVARPLTFETPASPGAVGLYGPPDEAPLALCTSLHDGPGRSIAAKTPAVCSMTLGDWPADPVIHCRTATPLLSTLLPPAPLALLADDTYARISPTLATPVLKVTDLDVKLQGRFGEAFAKEMNKHVKFRTFRFVPRDALPLGAERAPLNLILDEKVDATKCKATVRGDLLSPLSADQTSAPTAGPLGIPLLLLSCCVERRDLWFSDIEGAFLQSDATRVVRAIYSPIPPCVFEYFSRHDTPLGSPDDGDVMLWEKLVYGTPEACKGWFEDLGASFDNIELRSSPLDSCLRRAEGQLVLIHVDDLGGSSRPQCTPVIERHLRTNYSMRFFHVLPEGETREFLALTIGHWSNGYTLDPAPYLNQHKQHVLEIQDQLATLTSQQLDAPLSNSVPLLKAYEHITGVLVYVAWRACPEGAFLASSAARNKFRATVRDLKQFISTFLTLQSSVEPLWFPKLPVGVGLSLVSYVDASQPGRAALRFAWDALMDGLNATTSADVAADQSDPRLLGAKAQIGVITGLVPDSLSGPAVAEGTWPSHFHWLQWGSHVARWVTKSSFSSELQAVHLGGGSLQTLLAVLLDAIPGIRIARKAVISDSESCGDVLLRHKRPRTEDVPVVMGIQVLEAIKAGDYEFWATPGVRQPADGLTKPRGLPTLKRFLKHFRPSHE